MVGQETLCSRLFGLIATNSLPRTVLLEGPWGCGKHTLVQEMASKLSLDVKDITDDLNLEMLDSIHLDPLPHVYLIDASRISIKEQNVILKFLEEPLATSYIVLLVESCSTLLPTVKNRCYICTFSGYSEEDLLKFWEDDNQKSHPVAACATTPGRVKQFRESSAVECWEMANKILGNVDRASYSNLLTIPTKFYYKDKVDDKLCFDLFLYLLQYAALNSYRDAVINYDVFKYTKEFLQNARIPNISKSVLFEHFLITLKQKISR